MIRKKRGPMRLRVNADQFILGDARRWLKKHARDPGVICPCCGQDAKIYPRTIHSTIARMLIHAARRQPRDFFHVMDYLTRPQVMGKEAVAQGGGDWAKLRHWGLIEPMKGERADGSNRTGFWRVTFKGVAFVEDLIKVPREALVYGAKFLGLDDSKGLVGIRDCLGKRFNYDELMNA